MDKQITQLVSAYLRRFRWALSALPTRDADEIVNETRSHIFDRIEAGDSFDVITAGIGQPENYAKQFVNEHAAAAAVSTQHASDLVTALFVNAGSNVVARVALGFLLSIWILVLTLTVVAAAKIFNPENVGLWVGDGVFIIGSLEDHSKAQERLGFWIFPIVVTLILSVRIITRYIAMWALNKLKAPA